MQVNKKIMNVLELPKLIRVNNRLEIRRKKLKVKKRTTKNPLKMRANIFNYTILFSTVLTFSIVYVVVKSISLTTITY